MIKKILNKKFILVMMICTISLLVPLSYSRFIKKIELSDTIHVPSSKVVVHTIEDLITNANSSSVTNYEDGDGLEMYTFSHAATGQTGTLTDYRYIGNDPNNYVYFNCSDETDDDTCEKWRIIGVFEVEDANGNSEYRIKITSANSLTEQMKWGSNSDIDNSIFGAYLNGDYYDSLLTTSKNMIENTKYYYGGISQAALSAEELYSQERGNTATQSRPLYWINKIGLMYVSDEYYTYAYGVNDACYTKATMCYKQNAVSSWLYNSNNRANVNSMEKMWFLNRRNGDAQSTFYMDTTGVANYISASYSSYSVRPVLYLSSDVMIKSGVGSETNPYKLYIPEVLATEKILSKANSQSITNYEDGDTGEMYTFSHASTAQTPALTDYRYIGNNPNNYVYFNCTDDTDISTCEIWRIIGVFDVDDGTGNYEQKVKLVSGSILDKEYNSSGTAIAMSSKINNNSKNYKGINKSSTTLLAMADINLNSSHKYIKGDKNNLVAIEDPFVCNSGCMAWDTNNNNDWSNATLKTYLNTNYYNSLSNSSKAMISTSKYYLGGGDLHSLSTNDIYSFERSNSTYSERPNNWLGKIALMYLSDYYMPYGMGVDTSCYNNPNSCSSYYDTHWLENNIVMYYLTPISSGNYVYAYLYMTGVSSSSTSVQRNIQPVLYLKSNVKIVDGNGSADSPYVLRYSS